jgi:glycosyltransferase involved in cell wall biosynthesis
VRRVLIFNFFGGVMDRGIPLYAHGIATCMQRLGIEAIELRCPRWLQGAPRAVRNSAFVLFEQLIAPLMRVLRGCSWTVYPYNSAGMFDALLGRSVLVVHDLIPNHRSDVKLAARYIRLTQTIHRRLSRPVCAASPHTLAQLRRLPAFRRCALRLWSNPFYAFEAALARRSNQEPVAPGPLRVLLCSGMNRNKDYRGALALFRKSRLLAQAQLRIVGFGDDAALAMRRVLRLPAAIRERVCVLPRLSIEQLVEEYMSANLVWVHSQKEGFGRCVTEALLCRKPVIASDIGAFRRLLTPDLHLYRADSFESSIELAMSQRVRSAVSFEGYHAALEVQVRELFAGAA